MDNENRLIDLERRRRRRARLLGSGVRQAEVARRVGARRLARSPEATGPSGPTVVKIAVRFHSVEGRIPSSLTRVNGRYAGAGGAAAFVRRGSASRNLDFEVSESVK